MSDEVNASDIGAATLLLANQDAQPMDRVPYPNEVAEQMLDLIGEFPPEVRAQVYATYRMKLNVTGLDGLTDGELFYLAWAPNDVQATSAIDEMEGFVSPSWYDTQVSFGGSSVAARDELLSYTDEGENSWLDRFGNRMYQAGQQMVDFWVTDPIIGPTADMLYPAAKGQAEDAYTELGPIGRGQVGDFLNAVNEIDLRNIGKMHTNVERAAITGENVAHALTLLAGGTLAAKSAITAARAGGSKLAPKVIAQVAKYPNLTARFSQFSKASIAARNKLVTSPIGKAFSPLGQALSWVGRAAQAPFSAVVGRQIPVASTAAQWAGGTPLQAVSSWMIMGGTTIPFLAGLFGGDEAQEIGEERRAEQERERQEAAEQGIPTEGGLGQPPTIPEGEEAFSIQSLVDVRGQFQELVAEMIGQETLAHTEAEARDQAAMAVRASYQVDSRANNEYWPSEERMEEAVDDVVTNGTALTEIEEYRSSYEAAIDTTLEELAPYGVRMFDPTVDDEAELNQQGTFVVAHPSDPEGSRIVVPPTIMQAPGLPYDPTATPVTQFGRFVNQKVEGDTEDPYIRVGKDYVGRTWRVQDRYLPMDPAEANFISRAQGVDLYETSGTFAPRYRESDVQDMMATMSPAQVYKFQSLAAQAGFYDRQGGQPAFRGHITEYDEQVIRTVMGQVNVGDVHTGHANTFWGVLDEWAEQGKARTAAGRQEQVKANDPFVVPAHLRAIPGPKTVAEDVKQRFAQKVGRPPTDDELTELSHALTGYHDTSRREEIALYMGAYEGDNQGLLTGAQLQRIEDPGAALSYDVGETWANEINLNERRETNSDSFRRMLNATMGNRPSIAGANAAAGVSRIGR